MKTIKELRNEFEKTNTFKIYHSWQMDFDDKAECYYSLDDSLRRDIDAINAALTMFQELNK